MALIIRADADPDVGLGHLMRCLAIADWVRSAGVPVLFAVHNPAADVRLMIGKVHGHELREIISRPGSHADAEELVAVANSRQDYVLLDGYRFGDGYENILGESRLHFAVMDDYGHAEHSHAKVVVNGNLFYGRASRYGGPDPAIVRLLGPAYTPLRREFSEHRKSRACNGTIKKVLVSLGGGDYRRSLVPVLDTLTAQLGSKIEVFVTTGLDQSSLKANAQQFRQKYPMIRWNGALDLPVLMASANLAISAGGMTSYELAYMGVPSILLPATPAEAPVSAELAALGAAMSLGLDDEFPQGAFEEALQSLTSSPDLLKEMSERGQVIFDGYGAMRVAQALVRSSPVSIACQMRNLE